MTKELRKQVERLDLMSQEASAMDYSQLGDNLQDIAKSIREQLTSLVPPQPVTQPLTDEQASALGKVALEKWNAQADEYNHWDNLGLDEMSLLITREVEAVHNIPPAGDKT